MSKNITNQQIAEGLQYILKGSDTYKKKERKFTETVELQIGLKDYDPQKDKRFAGSVRLPHIPRQSLKICLIGDAKHIDIAKAQGIQVDVMDFDGLKTFNKDKKLIKKWAQQYALLLASDTLIKKIPVVLGPILNKIQMFPQVVTHNEDLRTKVDDARASIKFQLKKVTCMAVAIGNEKMTEEELRQNILMGVNFLVSLLKKGWHNLKSVHIKTTMGKPYKIYG
jgi:large subunit ribosomal protein L10Ae